MRQSVDATLDGRPSARRAVVPLLILATMFATMTAVGTFAYNEIRTDVLELSDQLFTALSQRIEAEVLRYFEPASELVSLVASLSRDADFRAAPYTLTEKVGVGIVARYPQISAFLIADELGNFVMAQRQPDGAVYSRFVERTDSGGQGRWIFRDLDGRVTRSSRPEPDSFDPRPRAWYQGADRMQGLFWSGVYTFYRSQQPGLTVAAPLIDAMGITLGVVGVDIQLATLSSFLAQLEVSEHGEAVIVDSDGRLIAHPSLDKLMIEGEDGPEIARVDELDDPVLERAYDRFQIESHGLRTITVDDIRYVSDAVSLLSSVGREWTILLVAPEDDFAGFVARNFQVLLLLASSLVILGAALAALLMVQGRRADRNVQLVREGRAELDAQTNAFSELADLVAGFKVGDDVGRSKLTEIVARATGVTRMSIWRLDDDQVLRCVDCFETAIRGHTDGTELHRSEMESLFKALQEDSEVAVSNAAADARTEPLHRLYLHAMGCQALLVTPFYIENALGGILMLEDHSGTRIWTRREVSFLHTVASMIAARMRDAELAASIRDRRTAVEPGVRTAETSGGIAAPGRLPAPAETMRAADLGENRFSGFAKALEESGLDGANTGADVFPAVTVAVLWLNDPIRLAGQSTDHPESNAMNGLIKAAEILASELNIHYLKIAGDELVLAAGFGGEPTDGARDIARMALGIRDHCENLLGAAKERLEFRLGIDTGPTMGSAVGHGGRAYNLWGEATRTARSMAHSGISGCIQVTETTYDLLRDEFLFRARGRFFIEEFGESGTYILADQL